MLSVLRRSVAASVMLVAACAVSPAMAQTAGDTAVRMGQLEDEVRQLTGQVEDLSNQVRQLKAQIAANAGGGTAVPAAPLKLKKLSSQQPAPAAPQPQPSPAAAAGGQNDIQVSDAPASDSGNGQGIEQIQDNADSVAQASAPVTLRRAPGPKVLGGLAGSNASAQVGDGGFQGQVLVAPGQQDAGADAAVMQQQQLAQAAAPAAPGGDASADGGGGSDGVQQVALSGDSPDALYEHSNESLLKRQFGDAEAGFQTFLQKYPDHPLAGNAQYWLGETYYAQSDYRQAAQAFLQGYRKYPDSRRAADSLLKLGISLNRLGQAQQACAAFASVDANYPKAVDVRRRAQAEAKRANCAS